jgi:hypothetical protein
MKKEPQDAALPVPILDQFQATVSTMHGSPVNIIFNKIFTPR